MAVSFMIANEDIPAGAKVTGLTGKLEDTIAAVAGAGFNSFELMIADPEKVNVGKVERLEKQFSLKCVFLCTGEMAGTAGLYLNHIDANERKRALNSFLQAAEKAHDLGVNLNIGRLRGVIWSDGLQRSLERLGESLERIDSYVRSELEGLSVLIEPLRKVVCPILNNCAETASFLSERELNSFGILLDSDHFDEIEDSFFVNSNIELIKHVHLADSNHKPLGRGAIDFQSFLNMLSISGYVGDYSVEVFCDEDQIETLRDTASFLKAFPHFLEGSL